MFSRITKLFKNVRNHSTGQAPSQTNQTAAQEHHTLNVTPLNITSSHLKSIQTRMAEKSRAEFAAVTKALNASQQANRSEQELIKF
jgi:ERCC4-type nuclease